jgi:ribosomal protein S21
MGNEIAKNWETKKEETPEQKFSKMYEEFKLDVIRSGVLKEYRDHEYYVKPSQKRRMKIAESRMKAKQNQKRNKKGK